MSESKGIMTLRAMAWERAKGELRAYLQTFWPDFYSSGKEIDSGFNLSDEKIQAFIKDFEDNCR